MGAKMDAKMVLKSIKSHLRHHLGPQDGLREAPDPSHIPFATILAPFLIIFASKLAPFFQIEPPRSQKSRPPVLQSSNLPVLPSSSAPVLQTKVGGAGGRGACALRICRPLPMAGSTACSRFWRSSCQILSPMPPRPAADPSKTSPKSSKMPPKTPPFFHPISESLFS